ncbi:MAG TPA: hopanoid biosynthesis associated radical SAM protein HpnJ, partial [Candidatus Dormibacteraeota bacterium]|nr:hopanoid biosynthesis associated radical SAM protein HpnJ [Candidatus Dormibacteraeota bacterium]
NKEEIFEAVDRFYRSYYLRPKPILRIIKTMLEDKDVFVRRCREGYEFFRSLRQRKSDLEAARQAAGAPG